ncbi:MAG: hypothetical protein JNM39_14010 [Bdellovibrionaceae bacterium]|nr:hypothetical protein [Pseudobdellovibrionaceae bacterium]
MRSSLKSVICFFLNISFICCGSSLASKIAFAGPSSGSGYMTSGKNESFVAKVKVVRTIQGETEIFFESNKVTGAYLLANSLKDYATLKDHLETSRKPGGPEVKVTADDEKRIKTVEILENKPPSSSQEVDWDKI